MPQCSWMGVEDTQERFGEFATEIKSSLLLLASGQSYPPCNFSVCKPELCLAYTVLVCHEQAGDAGNDEMK